MEDLESGTTLEVCMRILYCARSPGNRTCTTVYTGAYATMDVFQISCGYRCCKNDYTVLPSVPSQLKKVNVSSTYHSITASWLPVKGSRKYVASLVAIVSKVMKSKRNFRVYKVKYITIALTVNGESSNTVKALQSQCCEYEH